MNTAPSNPASKDAPLVLIIDDDEELCELMAIRLESRGYQVSSEHSGRSGLARLTTDRFDAIILDLRLGDMNGLDLLVKALDRSPSLSIIVLTAHGTIETAVEAMRRGAFGFMTKPFQNHELLEKLAEAVERSAHQERMAREAETGVSQIENRLTGVSEAIKRVRDLVRRIGPTDATVLITGESGTGKEMAARSLHALSPRTSGPFVPLNCGALPPELLTSELFGHVKGAFTGATHDREGLFGAARGGTLFLDEIGEASPDVQVRLLRVLQEQRYTPVGATGERQTDVRIIAATNRDLRTEVASKRFREDLFYRLHVVPLTMPPLRERRDDIPLLAEMFLERAATRHGVQVPRIAQDAQRLLVQHAWPGNVRQLMHVMEAAVLLGGSATIEARHLEPLLVTVDGGNTPAPERSDGALGESDEDDYSGMLNSWFEGDTLPPFREARLEFERLYLTEALRRAQGNVTAAAKMAGRHRSDFYDLLRRHNLSRNRFKPE